VKARKKLGEILVEGGLLTQEQLEKALPYQKKSNLKLGQFLVREGIVSESQIVDLVSSQLPSCSRLKLHISVRQHH
jgi:type IV pilus assembly protein PilB